MPQQSHAGPLLTRSLNRPQSANRTRPTSDSIVKASFETVPVHRRWKSSSVAWASYHRNDIKARYDSEPYGVSYKPTLYFYLIMTEAI